MTRWWIFLMSLIWVASTTAQGVTPWSQRIGLVLSSDLSVSAVRDFSFAAVITPSCGGIQVGDRIRELNGRPVHSKREFERVAQELANSDLQAWSFLTDRHGSLLLLEPAKGYPCDPSSLLRCGPSLHTHWAKPLVCKDIDGKPI